MLAALLASDSDTELGFFLKSVMVLRAACFCAHVVPWLGGGGDAAVPDEFEPDPTPSLEKRDCSSLLMPPDGGSACLGLLPRGGGGGCKGLPLPLPLPLAPPPPMPSPGTDTPAAPSRLSAPWLRNPTCWLSGGAWACAPGEAEFVRGGSRGGRLGGGGLPADGAAVVV